MMDPIASRLSEAQSYGPDLGLFAARLRETRELRRMTLQDVADASGFTKPHVWELEKGTARNPTVRAVWSLARALCDRCIADDMIDDDEEPYVEPEFECAGFNDGTGFYCPLWGSEECDWECPEGGMG